MTFDDWLESFEKDKTVVSRPNSDDPQAYDIHRYVDQTGIFWERGRTYTGRIVIRSGTNVGVGAPIAWEPWLTLHHVKLD